jgi:N4-gp56 family major capsid protein
MPTEISIGDVADAISTLVNNNAFTIESRITGENKFGTAPVRDAYIGIVNSQVIKDLENLAEFNPKWNYPRDNDAHPSEWGAVRNLRVLVTSIGYSTAQASALNATVYKMFIAGLEAAGIVKQSGATAQFIYRPREFSGALAQSVTLGWKMASAQVVLDDLWVIVLNMTKKA